jgi:hypothetical protein
LAADPDRRHELLAAADGHAISVSLRSERDEATKLSRRSGALDVLSFGDAP